MKLKDRKELAEVLKVLAADLKNSDKFVLGVFTPDEVLSDVKASVERVAAKYRRWADELMKETPLMELRARSSARRFNDMVHVFKEFGLLRGQESLGDGTRFRFGEICMTDSDLSRLMRALTDALVHIGMVDEPAPEEKPEKTPSRSIHDLKPGDPIWVYSDFGWECCIFIAFRPTESPLIYCVVLDSMGRERSVPGTAVSLTDPNLEQAGSPK